MCSVSVHIVCVAKIYRLYFWPVTPRYYFERAKAVSLLVDRIIISELQAEPWLTTGDFRYHSMNNENYLLKTVAG